MLKSIGSSENGPEECMCLQNYGSSARVGMRCVQCWVRLVLACLASYSGFIGDGISSHRLKRLRHN